MLKLNSQKLDKLINAKNLNTSHVKVKPKAGTVTQVSFLYLNTSHVKVKQDDYAKYTEGK